MSKHTKTYVAELVGRSSPRTFRSFHRAGSRGNFMDAVCQCGFKNWKDIRYIYLHPDYPSSRLIEVNYRNFNFNK